MIWRLKPAISSIVFLSFLVIYFFLPNQVLSQEGLPLEGACYDNDLYENVFDCQLMGDQSWGVPWSNCSEGFSEDRFVCGGKIIDSPPSLPCDPYGDVEYCCLPCKPDNSPADAILRGEPCGDDIVGECDISQGLECREGICVYQRPVVGLHDVCFDSSECIQQPYLGGFSPNTTYLPTACLGSSPTTCEIADGYCQDDEDCTSEDAVCDLGACVTVYEPPPDPPSNDIDVIEGTPFEYCSQLPDDPDVEDDFSDPTTQRGACAVCVGPEGPQESGKIFTALGCIDVSYEGLASDLIRLLVGISGGVALLTILAASFLLAISQGDSSKVKQAKEMITSAVVGLFFLIFSVYILEFIGVSVLRIPGLSGGSTGGSGPPVNPPPSYNDTPTASLVGAPDSCSQDADCNNASVSLMLGDDPIGGAVYCKQSECVIGGFYADCLDDEDPAAYCAHVTGHSQAYCVEDRGSGLCVAPVHDPEDISCDSWKPSSYCNTIMNANSGYHCNYQDQHCASGPLELSETYCEHAPTSFCNDVMGVASGYHCSPDTNRCVEGTLPGS